MFPLPPVGSPARSFSAAPLQDPDRPPGSASLSSLVSGWAALSWVFLAVVLTSWRPYSCPTSCRPSLTRSSGVRSSTSTSLSNRVRAVKMKSSSTHSTYLVVTWDTARFRPANQPWGRVCVVSEAAEVRHTPLCHLSSSFLTLLNSWYPSPNFRVLKWRGAKWEQNAVSHCQREIPS